MLKVVVYGDEYDQVRARMDWHVLPGVTEEWRTSTMPSLKDATMEGTGGNHFAASASDGTIGLAAFQCAHTYTFSLTKINQYNARPFPWVCIAS